MIVICNACGTANQIDPEHIRGETATFLCISCKSRVTISKEGKIQRLDPPKGRRRDRGDLPARLASKGGLGLRGKMLILFVIIPMCLFIGASFVYLNAMRSLSGLITKESSQLVTKAAETAVADKARAVAREAKLYLQTHPSLRPEDFNKDPQLREIAVQKIGQTGYTLLVSREDAKGQSFMWVHPRPDLVGIDIIAAMKKRLGPDYERWYKVQGKEFETGGYYLWIDKQEKYVWTAPIEGTNFNIAATAYLPEFTAPMQVLEQRAKMVTGRATATTIVVLVIAIVLTALSVVVYSYQLSGRLHGLSEAADRISVGDLDAEIKQTKSKDEIGDLTMALSRMQTSIKLAMRRLRERG
jgi:HAMP domain-containing protein